MPNREILFKDETQAKIARGVDIIADAVGSTFGPKGHCVLIESYDHNPTFSMDGVTVARNVELKDPFEKLGADAVRAASQKTNDLAGDGTTTAAVLARAIYSEGRKRVVNGANPTDVKAAIERETKLAVEALKSMAVSADGRLEQVASISCKDAVLGKIISDLITQVGPDGLITVEQSAAFDVTTELTKGFKLDTGYVANWMVTNPERMNTVMDECPVLVTDSVVGAEIVEIIKKFAVKGTKKLLVIADGFTNEALAPMFVNGSQGKFVTVGVRIAGIGDKRKSDVLLDVCAATGATLVSETTGKAVKDATPELCGQVRQAVITANDTLIVGGNGNQEEIEKRIGLVKAQIETEKSEYDLTKLKERLSRLTGSAGVIRVGGTNDAEIRERKMRVEDAVNAVRAAQAEGIVVGGGNSLLAASKGLSVLADALSRPFRSIVENAGRNPDVMLSFIGSDRLPSGVGYNVATDVWEDLMAAGVIDPLKVTRVALENAASVAGLLLVTECCIVNEREIK